MELYGYFRSSAAYRVRIAQSLAIIEYLEETRPEPPLLPKDAAAVPVRAMALSIACEIHPLNNLRVLGLPDQDPGRQRGAEEYLVPTLGRDRARNRRGDAGQRRAHRTLCHGDVPTLADVLLVPQIFNAQRFNCRLDHVPTVMRIH
jgi:glutathione S-transferase